MRSKDDDTKNAIHFRTTKQQLSGKNFSAISYPYNIIICSTSKTTVVYRIGLSFQEFVDTCD